jgi:hypothetical protein
MGSRIRARLRIETFPGLTTYGNSAVLNPEIYPTSLRYGIWIGARLWTETVSFPDLYGEEFVGSSEPLSVNLRGWEIKVYSHSYGLGIDYSGKENLSDSSSHVLGIQKRTELSRLEKTLKLRLLHGLGA